MSTVYYNGVFMNNVQTRKFEQTAVYDDTGTDFLYMKFSIRVTGYLHGIQNPANGIDIRPGNWSDTTNLGQGAQAVRNRLLSPRHEFIMALGRDIYTSQLVRARPPFTGPYGDPSQSLQTGNVIDAGVPVDLNNGPTPVSCTITNIAGGGALHIDFEIELHILECGLVDDNSGTGSYGPAYGVLSNRFSVFDDIDENWYVTRTTQGRLRIAQAANNAQFLRFWVIPPLQDGFRRASISCHVTPDGLNMDYTVVDKELYATPPYPGTSWTAVDTAETEVGASYLRTMKVSIEGFKSAAPWELFAVAANIVEQRLQTTKVYAGGAKNVLQRATITRHLHENRFEMSVTVLSAVPSDVSTLNYNPKDKWEWSARIPQKIFAPSGLFQGLDWKLFVMPYHDDDNDPNYRHNQATVPMGNNLGGDPTRYYGTGTTAGLFLSALAVPCVYFGGSTNFSEVKAAEPGKGYDSKTNNRGEPLPAESSTNINVAVGPELPPENELSGKDIIASEDPYTFYDIQTAYMTAQNVVSLPVASTVNAVAVDEYGDPIQQINPISTVFVRMAPPQTTRKVVVTAQRYGKWPSVPSFKSVTLADGTVLRLVGDAKITPRYPELSADKTTRRYELVCEYEHVTDRPFLAAQSLPVGKAAYDRKDLASLQVSPAVFDPTLMT